MPGVWTMLTLSHIHVHNHSVELGAVVCFAGAFKGESRFGTCIWEPGGIARQIRSSGPLGFRFKSLLAVALLADYDKCDLCRKRNQLGDSRQPGRVHLKARGQFDRSFGPVFVCLHGSLAKTAAPGSTLMHYKLHCSSELCSVFIVIVSFILSLRAAK